MPRLDFNQTSAILDGLTPESIGAAPATVVNAQIARITQLETRVTALEQQLATFFDRSFDLQINPTATTR